MDSQDFLPPKPRALSDEELQEVLERAKLEGGGILSAMQILEAQAQLRETDKSELRAWEAQRQTSPQVQVETMRPAVTEVHSEEEDATALDEEALKSIALPVTVPEPTNVSPLSEPEKIQPVAELAEIVPLNKRLAKDPSSSQFWVWLTFSGSLLPFGIALWLRSLGLTFGQSVTAAVLGLFTSAGVVAVGAIAGKRASLPTLVLSRAAFGVFGNLAPATLLVLSRLFWALVLVILGYILIAQNLVSKSKLAGASEPLSLFAVAALVLLVCSAALLSALGGRKLVWAQRISGGLGVLVAVWVAVVRFTASGLATESVQHGSWLRALGASVVIFAVFGLAWSSASSDYASGLPVNVRGWKVAGWSILAMGVVPTGLTLLGLAAFGDLRNADFAKSFDRMIAGQALTVLNVFVVLSIACSLITTIAMSLRSSSMSFESVQLKIKVSVATPVIALITVVLAVLGIARMGSSGFWFNLQGYALFLAVPVAAWSGVFVSDVLIRRIAYHEVSLSRFYGFYKRLNLTNLLGWFVAVALGWGLLRTDLPEFSWLGYLTNYASNSEFWRESNFGVVIAFAIGLLLPVAGGIPRIKRQETEVLLIESRRNDLKDVLGLVD
jgi:NCS1 family nucleobase:cation symporter-1